MLRTLEVKLGLESRFLHWKILPLLLFWWYCQSRKELIMKQWNIDAPWTETMLAQTLWRWRGQNQYLPKTWKRCIKAWVTFVNGLFCFTDGKNVYLQWLLNCGFKFLCSYKMFAAWPFLMKVCHLNVPLSWLRNTSTGFTTGWKQHLRALGLQRVGRFFYVVLVRVVATLANMDNNNPNEQIEANEILVPPLPDLLQLCKLMYHAISNLRFGICDGQHRMGAILHALFDWQIMTIYPVAEDQPLTTFAKCGRVLQSDKLGPVLLSLSAEVMVWVILPPSVTDWVSTSVSYSLGREDSQRSHKPWVLVNLWVLLTLELNRVGSIPPAPGGRVPVESIPLAPGGRVPVESSHRPPVGGPRWSPCHRPLVGGTPVFHAMFNNICSDANLCWKLFCTGWSKQSILYQGIIFSVSMSLTWRIR